MYKKRNQLYTFFICLLNCLLALCSFILAGLIRYRNMALLLRVVDSLEIVMALTLASVAFFYAFTSFDRLMRRTAMGTLVDAVKINLCIAAAMTVYSFVTKNEMALSRLTLGYLALLNTALLGLAHLAIRWLYKRSFLRNQALAPHLLLFVERGEATNAVARVRQASNWQNVLTGIVLIDGDGRDHADQVIGGAPVVASLENYLEYATGHVVDEALILPGQLLLQSDLLREIIVNLETMGIVVNLQIQAVDTGLNDAKRVYQFGEYFVIGFSARLFDIRLLLLKRLMDILGGLVGLLITGILGLIIAPLILLESPGSVFFVQERVGRNGRVFRMCKFRSMYQDAEARKAAMADQNEMSGPMFKMRNDPRVTRVGRFLRRTSMDELPQFWNVLRGDMSLVGTRPPTLAEYLQYNHQQKRRLSFRPGLTGLWQISGRNDISDFDQVVKLDLEYIDTWSIALDSKILLKTVKAVLERRGAA